MALLLLLNRLARSSSLPWYRGATRPGIYRALVAPPLSLLQRRSAASGKQSNPYDLPEHELEMFPWLVQEQPQPQQQPWESKQEHGRELSFDTSDWREVLRNTDLSVEQGEVARLSRAAAPRSAPPQQPQQQPQPLQPQQPGRRHYHRRRHHPQQHSPSPSPSPSPSWNRDEGHSHLEASSAGTRHRHAARSGVAAPQRGRGRCCCCCCCCCCCRRGCGQGQGHGHGSRKQCGERESHSDAPCT